MTDVDQDMFMDGHAITTKTLAGKIARELRFSLSIPPPPKKRSIADSLPCL